MKLQYLILAIFISIALYSCDDIFLANLESEQVELVTPPDNFATTTQTQHFFWEQLEGADEYTIRIVSPDFQNPIDVVIEETVTDNFYSVTLSPGTYQWRVIAANSGSESAAIIRNLHILADSTLDNQNVNILSPTDALLTNDTSVNVLWQPLILASIYRIQVGQPDFSHSSFIILNDTTSNDTYTLNLGEGNYQFRIRAENNQSVSNYTTQNITIDLTPPIEPTLVTPMDGDTSFSPITLTWSPASDATLDTLYISQDSTFTTIDFQSETTNTSYDYTTSILGSYFWRLRSVDEAGNTSNYSETRKFIIE